VKKTPKPTGIYQISYPTVLPYLFSTLPLRAANYPFKTEAGMTIKE
jgi:hypothetical protein